MLLTIGTVALALCGLIAYVLLIIGTHREPRRVNLRAQAPTPLTAFTRRVLGVYVQRPAEDDTQKKTRGFTTAGRK